MTKDQLIKIFEDNDNEFLKFENMPLERRLSNRLDLHAFLLLDKIVAGTTDIIFAAEHDEIFLEVDLKEVANNIEKEQVIDLIRCGVRLSEFDCFAMFV